MRLLNVTWNTLSDVYVCGSMWKHVILYKSNRYKGSKSALPIKTCWILWIPNQVTLFVFQPALSYFTAYQTRQWRHSQLVILFIQQHKWHAASLRRQCASNTMIKLISSSSSSLLSPSCTVRQSQSRHPVSGCHIKHCPTLFVAEDCVYICVCVYAYMFVCVWNHLGSISGGSWRLCPAAEESRADRAQAQRLSPPYRRATTALFSLRFWLSDDKLHTSTCTNSQNTHTLPQEAAESAADFHAFKNPPPCGPWIGTWVCLCVSELRRVWTCMCFFLRDN